MSTEWNYHHNLEGHNVRGNAYIVGVPVPGLERYGDLKYLTVFNFDGVALYTDKPCENGNDQQAWHDIRPAFADPAAPTTYMHDYCAGCGCIVRPYAKDRCVWCPQVRLAPDGTLVAETYERTTHLPDFPYGYPTRQEAQDVAERVRDRELAACGAPPYRVVHLSWDNIGEEDILVIPEAELPRCGESLYAISPCLPTIQQALLTQQRARRESGGTLRKVHDLSARERLALLGAAADLGGVRT